MSPNSPINAEILATGLLAHLTKSMTDEQREGAEVDGVVIINECTAQFALTTPLGRFRVDVIGI